MTRMVLPIISKGIERGGGFARKTHFGNTVKGKEKRGRNTDGNKGRRDDRPSRAPKWMMKESGKSTAKIGGNARL